MSTRLLTLRDSELMAQHQDLGVLPPRLPARQPEQRHGTGNNQEDQLQAHKPKIIAPPAGQDLPATAPDTGTEPTGVRGRICPGGTGFRHPQPLAELRRRQQTPEGRAKLRERVAVEHALAHVGHWQGRRARYRGTHKNLFDLRRVAVVHDLHVIARQPTTDSYKFAA